MDKVIKLFKQIQETSGLNDKKAIMMTNKDNELFKKCLKFLLDPNIVTGISDQKINKDTPTTRIDCAKQNLKSFEEVMEYLEEHNTGKDEDIANIKKFIYDNSIINDNDVLTFYTQMITKKYRLGADAKLVNKCIPGLIPTFDVMLGTPIEKVKLKGNEWLSISRKLNGCRCAFVGDKCMTRQGKEYVGLDHIIKDIKMLGYSDFFIDGELLYKNKEKLSDSEAFQKGTGIAMSKDNNKTDLKFVIFDMFPLEQFWQGKSELSYKERQKKYLKALNKDIIRALFTENIEIVPMFYEGKDHSQIWKWLDYAEENDFEGIMLNLDTPYECKRTKNLIKVKKFFSADLKCIAMEEGSGRNKCTLGSLVCDYKGYKINVGTGFSDSKREQFWLNPGEVVGRIVTIKYKEETKNKNGGLSLQFPVFETVRFDKTEPSYN